MEVGRECGLDGDWQKAWGPFPTPMLTVKGLSVFAGSTQVFFFKQLQGPVGRGGDRRTGSENGLDSGIVEKIVVAGGNDASGHHHDILAALFPQFGDQGRDQGLVTGGETGGADDMDIIFDGHLGRFFRGLEHRADIDVKAQVGIGAGDHLEAPVMAILAHLGDQQPRASALGLEKFGSPGLQGGNDL